MTIFLTDDQIRALPLDNAAIVGTVEAAYRERGAGRVSLISKIGFNEADGGFRHAMPVQALGLAAVKWVVSGRDELGSRYINATLILSDRHGGQTLAVLGAEWITALRTGAVTVAVLKRLAGPRRVAAMIGCGLQARIHAAMLPMLGIRSIVAYSRRKETAAAFVADLAELGLEGTVVTSPREAVAAGDVVISAIPLTANTEPFLDARWLRPGAFAASIDLGKPWINDSLGRFAAVWTDDIPHAEGMRGGGHLAYHGRFDADLASLLSADEPAAVAGPVYMVAPGNAISDVALGRLIIDHLAQAGRLP
jgi:ornithine cyclodeaminase/alanine dehydrogenase